MISNGFFGSLIFWRTHIEQCKPVELLFRAGRFAEESTLPAHCVAASAGILAVEAVEASDRQNLCCGLDPGTTFLWMTAASRSWPTTGTECRSQETYGSCKHQNERNWDLVQMLTGWHGDALAAGGSLPGAKSWQGHILPSKQQNSSIPEQFSCWHWWEWDYIYIYIIYIYI